MQLDLEYHPHVTETDQFYYVEIRHSLSDQARKLGGIWCIYERSWRIAKTHPNAMDLISMAGYATVLEKA